jgi:phenylacetate-CoA ligase
MSSKAEAIYMAAPVWLQNLLVSSMGYRLYQKRYTGLYQQLLEQVRESREWTPAQRETWQNQQLHEMVKHCRHHIPWYQKVFADHGLHEQDVTSLADLHKLPVLNKQTMRMNADEFRSATDKPWAIQRTSGSTGTPLALMVNEHTYKLAMALVAEHEEYHGVAFGERRATFAGRMVQKPDNLQPPFARYNRAENQRIYSSYHLNRNTFRWYEQDLNRFQPRELIGYPSALYDLASHYQRTNRRPRFNPTAIVTNSETLLTWQRETLEVVFKCPVVDYYGTSEYILFAGQDISGRYYVNPLLGIAELCSNPDQSDSGTIIATTLTNTCMPLLRYRIGDTATLEESRNPGTAPVSSFKEIIGRIDDYVETADGRRIGRLDDIAKGLTRIRETQIIQTAIDHCIIRVASDGTLQESDKEQITHNFRRRISDQIRITFEPVAEIPRGPNGKFRNVISMKGSDHGP